MREGHINEIRLIETSPLPNHNPPPLVILIHNGGYIMCANIQWIPWARPIAALYGAIVALLSCRLASEYKFPFAAHDIWDSISWLASRAECLGPDLGLGSVVGGCLAGASLAIVTAHRELKQPLSPITGILANIPTVKSSSSILLLEFCHGLLFGPWKVHNTQRRKVCSLKIENTIVIFFRLCGNRLTSIEANVNSG